MLTKKILKTPYTKVKVKDLTLPNETPSNYLVGGDSVQGTPITPLIKMTDFFKEVKNQILIQNPSKLYHPYTKSYHCISLVPSTPDIDITNAVPQIVDVPIGATLTFRFSSFSSTYRCYIRIVYEDNSFTELAFMNPNYLEDKSITLTKKIKKIVIYNSSASYRYDMYISGRYYILPTNYYDDIGFIHSSVAFGGTDITKLIDDKSSFIPITLRDTTIGTLKDYFSTEEITTLFNYFVDYNYNLSTSFLTTEGIDDFYKRFRRLNTKALFRLATRINKIVELLNTDKMQDRKDIISRIKIDMLDKDDVISNTSNIKQADNPSNITGELVDTFTTSQQKATNSGTNAINEERNVTDNESLSSEGATINKINDYYNSINFDVIDEYVNSFNSLIINDDEDDLQFEDF